MNTNNSTTEKLIASPVSILVISFFIVLINLFWFLPTESSLRTSISNVERSTVRTAAAEIDSFLENRKNEVVIPAGYISEDLGSMGNDLILRKILRGEYLSSVTLSDKDGNEVIKYDKYRTMMDKNLSSVFDKKDFRQAIKTKEVSWSEASFSLRSEPSITVNVPIFSSNKDLAGVLSAEFRINAIFSAVSSLGPAGDSQIYVVDQNGILVSGRDLSLVLKNTDYSDRKIVKDTLISENNMIVSSNNGEYSYENEAGVKVLVAGARVSKTGWAVIFEEPKSRAVADITKLTFFALGSTIFIIILIIFIRAIYLKVVLSGIELEKVLSEQKELFQKAEILKKNLEEGNKNLIEKDRKIVEKVSELENFQKFTVNRELRMVELKNEIAELKSRLPQI